MLSIDLAVFCGLLVAVLGDDELSFPSGFKFGVATAAYQIEGAWNVSDKGESIWDRFSHTYPEKVNNDTGDVACDSYHLYKEDIKAVVETGAHFYRISLAWSRILPEGFPNKVSEDGVRYYNDVINEIIRNNIEPLVTLYHWDLPQTLQDLGGWANPLVADWFADYSRIAYNLFGDRVKIWITVNEPFVVCDIAYNTGYVAPGIKDSERAMYVCNKNLLMAHAKAWRVYDAEFKASQKGRVSIDNHIIWFEPETPEEQSFTNIAREYHIGRYVHPIYSKEGGWPPVIEQIIAENSKKEGYVRSRLEPFTEEERRLVQGTYDYFGFNHYISRTIRKAKPGEKVSEWPMGGGIPDLGAIVKSRPEWPIGGTYYFTIYPKGLRDLLNYLKNRYGDFEYFIMENGYGTTSRTLQDDDRIQHINDFLKQLLLSIKDGVNVIGYSLWSIIDNYEWTSGYSVKFGIYDVDFTNPSRPRTARKSAKFYAEVIKKNSLNVTVD